LIKFLGDEVKQAGSDINTQRSRFDFTFPRALTTEEKTQIERWVNDRISENLTVKKESLPFTEAVKAGARAFFKDKYPDTVDVYTLYSKDTDEVISKEVCGGPHVADTSEIGKFKIAKEQSSSAGVRRIRAVIE
jgi:alanyl-tRNA synthetase